MIEFYIPQLFGASKEKPQLFPEMETDFFRNRLTHSLEVAQIVSSIAIRLNNTDEFFARDGYRIDTDIVQAAGLAHDIGHPPFGHNGEQALDKCMRSAGGFEGNAQTFRILSRLEKRQKDPESSALGVSEDGNGKDLRYELNLTYRTLAAVLKYDKQIKFNRGSAHKVDKGYYQSEASVVKEVKEKVLGGPRHSGRFKTVECHIMDIADDIAYSTFDLEDAFKGGFLTPLDILSAESPPCRAGRPR